MPNNNLRKKHILNSISTTNIVGYQVSPAICRLLINNNANMSYTAYYLFILQIPSNNISGRIVISFRRNRQLGFFIFKSTCKNLKIG